MLGHWLAQFGGDPIQAAGVWVDMMDDAYQALVPLAHSGRWVALETFNEQGMNVKYGEFSREVARLAWQRWGLHHVAINASVGTYNEKDKWRGIAESGLLEALQETDGRLGLHGYASWFIRAWHGNGWDYYDIRDYIHPNRTPDTLYEALKQQPWLYDGRYLATYTAFGCWNAPLYLREHYQELGRQYPGLKIHLTEFGLDNVKDPGIGLWAGGWLEWASKGAYNGYIRPDSSPAHLYALQLDWAEKQLQELPFVEAAHTFVYDASDHETDNWRNYRIDRLAVPELEKLWKGVTMPPDTACTATPSGSGTNIRGKPYYPEGEFIITLKAGEKVTALGIAEVMQSDGTRNQWVKVNYKEQEGWMNRGYVTLSCSDLPVVPAPPLVDTPPPPEEPPPTDVTELLKKVKELESQLVQKQHVVDALQAQVDQQKSRILDMENAATNALAYVTSTVSELKKIVP
ncbi:MAG: SH3 domain-containing protein [Anaerolineae bacterium]|nr:SH3 domain-containing protein [Anaerolineae bacterium]